MRAEIKLVRDSYDKIEKELSIAAKAIESTHLPLMVIEKYIDKAKLTNQPPSIKDFADTYNGCLELLIEACRDASIKLGANNTLPLVVVNRYIHILKDNTK